MIKNGQMAIRALASVITVAAIWSGVVHADESATWKQVREAGVLRCGAALSPPWVMRDPLTKAYSGLFPDLCRGFGEDVLHVKVEFVDTGWDNIVAGLQSGKWELSQALNNTPERAKAIAFSSAVMADAVSFVYNKNNPKFAGPIKDVHDLDKPDINIAVIAGSSNERIISALFKNAKITRLPGPSECQLALMTKRADMVFDNKSANVLISEANKSWSETYEPNPPLTTQAVTFGIRKDTPKEDQELLNQFVDSKVQSGEVDRLFQKAVQEMITKK